MIKIETELLKMMGNYDEAREKLFAEIKAEICKKYASRNMAMFNNIVAIYRHRHCFIPKLK